MRTPILPGRVQVLRPVGSGGFATVWLGWDPQLEAEVAVKILAENWALRADVRDRFVTEGRLLRRVDSSRVVPVFDVGELDDGRPYLVMAYLGGGTLAEMLADGRPPPADGRRLLLEVARGLVDLHAAGIVHRDVNPGNILLGERGAVLGDLGLAKDLAAGSGLSQPMGTGRYRAPEQLEFSAEVTPACDVYAFAHVVADVLQPAELQGRRLRTVLARARAQDPALRPGLAEVMAALSDDGISDRRRSRRRRAVAGVSTLLVVAAVGVTGYRWWTRPLLAWDPDHRVAVTVPYDWQVQQSPPRSPDHGAVAARAPDDSAEVAARWTTGAVGPVGDRAHAGCTAGQPVPATIEVTGGGRYTGQSLTWTCPDAVAYREWSLTPRGTDVPGLSLSVRTVSGGDPTPATLVAGVQVAH